MTGVDLETFRFDFDLTFAALLMNADGTVYHRYGGRAANSANGSLSMPSFQRLLTLGLRSHTEYAAKPNPPKRARKALLDYPVWAEKVKANARAGRPVTCTHCHFVFDVYRQQALADKTWSRDQIWRWPPPIRIGLVLARDEQERVTEVREGSPAHAAGLRAGDRLLQIGDQRILSHADLTWVLERTDADGATLPVRILRGDTEQALTLVLAKGWRTGTPREFSWRPSKWQLKPRPGFGGRDLKAAEKKALGLGPDALAFRVTYIVTWGEEPRYGHQARKAGIRKGDVVVSVGDAKLRDGQEFHTWWRLTRTPGEKISLGVVRGEKRITLSLEVIE